MNMLLAREDVESCTADIDKQVDSKQRIVLVSPFQRFNFMFKAKLEEISKDYKLDILSEAVLPDMPYVNVANRESEKEEYPSVIVDLRRLAVKIGDEIHLKPFGGYYEWFNQNLSKNIEIGTIYLFPKPRSKLQEKINEYRVNCRFNQHSIRILDRMSHLLNNDISGIVSHSKKTEYNLFSEMK